MTNLEKYKSDLDKLIKTGKLLLNAIRYECHRDEYKKSAKKHLGDKATTFLENLPDFCSDYQAWYSEGLALVRQLLPDRLDDFRDYYEKPRNRKNLTNESYRISDYLLNLGITDGMGKTIVGPEAAIRKFHQQLLIIEALGRRFESSLFEIEQLVQADLFDSELEASKALINKGFFRAGGALSGVVMEKHLAQVCRNHGIKIRKKNPTIGDLNEALKKAGVIGMPEWRLNQHLGALRNLCSHDKTEEPDKSRVMDLVTGVTKITKTLY